MPRPQPSDRGWVSGAIVPALTNALALLGLIVVIVTATPLVSWIGARLAGPWPDPTGDVLIVLAGSADENGIMGESTYLRSVYALLAYQHGGFREIVLSGGGAPVAIAESMRSFLECRGVPRAAIRLETNSASTRENALFTSALLSDNPGAKVLLTSDYHMLRASRAFRKAGLEVLPRPIPDVIKRGNFWERRWSAFIDVARELAVLLYYYARGWI